MTTHRTRRSAWSTLALTLVTGIVATGCGSDPGSDESASSPPSSPSSDAGTTPDDKKSGNACDIVSDDVAAKVLGVKIVRREPHGEPGSQSVSCIKGLERTNDPKGFSYVSASVIAGGAALVDQASKENGSKPIDGLGDRAIYLPSTSALIIVDGADAVQVQVVKAGVTGNQKDCVTVAKDVLSKRG